MTQTTTTTPAQPEWVLMAKALRGELTPTEQKEFSEWLNADAQHAQLWAEASEAWDKAGCLQNTSFTPDPCLAWDKICSSLSFAPSKPSLAKESAKKQEAVVRPMFALNQFIKYAAVLLVALGLGWLAYGQWPTSTDWTQIATLSGERKLVHLPDSSVAILNANSSLRYDKDFSGDTRQVELSGEAFFEVRKNPSQPFIISSGPATTKVLGTSFNVKALDNSEVVTVAVVSGKVVLANIQTNQEVLLLPGTTGILQPSGQLIKEETAVQETSTWRSLSFENTSLPDVARQLNDFFGVTISLASPSLKNCSFTGTFDHPDLKEIFKVLAASSDVTIKQEKPSTYIISGPGCR